MEHVSVLIKPVSGKCNIRCDYCFYMDEMDNRDIPDYGNMRLETAEEIIKKVFLTAEKTASFAFQGGEPTLRGLGFYRGFVSLVNEYNKNDLSVFFSIQTNGIIIDKEWAEFLHENSFLVGLSLDGPSSVHDRFRKNAAGEGTQARVIQTARLLDEYQVEYNILFTVTKEAAKKPEKMYEFFYKNGFKYLQFVPCIDPYYGTRGKDSFSLLPKDFSFFLKHFYEKWAEDVLHDRGISVRYYDNLCCIAAGLPVEACSMRGACACQFIFEADGSCYPCDFYVYEKWCADNIMENTLEEIWSSKAAQDFIRTGTRVDPECRSCKWFRVCRGGCRRDRDREPYRNYYCEAYKGFLDAKWKSVLQVSAYLVRKQMGERK